LNLSPIKPKKTYEAITEQLKQGIIDGTFPPGSKLPSVRELSEQMSVSQPAVREALSALKAMKLITMKQGEGTFVNHYNPKEITQSFDEWALMNKTDIQSLLELRKIIEAGTSRLAAKRRTNDDVERLETVLSKMREDISSFTVGEQADWEFHYEIARASQNQFLVSLMDSIGERIQSALLTSRQALFKIVDEPERLYQQHRDIFEAIAAGNDETAERRMLEHLSHVETALELPKR